MYTSIMINLLKSKELKRSAIGINMKENKDQLLKKLIKQKDLLKEKKNNNRKNT